MIGTRQGYVGIAIVLVFVGALLTVNLAGFGIWDPWELNAADAARRIVDHQPTTDASAPYAAIVAAGFRQLGVREWSGRLPIALFGVLASGVAFLFVRRFAGTTAALLASLITACNPLFILNSRLMLGEAPGFALQGLIAAGGAIATLEIDERISPSRRLAWLGAMLVALTIAIGTRGALLGALPPLLALAVVVLLQPAATNTLVRNLRWSVVLGAAFVALMCARAVFADAAEATAWIGATPRSVKPPSFDSVIERVFHGFAPWSALLPAALAHAVFATSDATTDEAPDARHARNLGWICLIWIGLGYGVQTLFVSRYGDSATFLPLLALAAVVALLLREVDAGDLRSRTAAFISLLFVGLLIRDFALYPSGPVEALAITGFELPKVVNPKVYWAIGLAAFALAAFIALAIDEGQRTDLRAPYRLLRTQWQRDWGSKLWLIAFALLLLGCIVVGLIAWIAPERARMATLVAKIARGVSLVPFALPIAIALIQLAYNVLLRVLRFRIVPLAIVGAGLAVYIAHGFLPTLSAHFSPREVYETYNRLATDADSLAEYRVGGRAATYYARGKVIDIEQQGELMRHLASKQRRWAAFPSEELATIDRQHRRATGEHLFAIDTGSARISLVTNQPLANRDNESFLVRYVLKAPPAKIQHPVRARFEDKLELLGYDLELPHDGYVGASESFAIKWYFRALKPIPGNYKIFLHIDGQGLRLNGDHEPLDGKYPVRMWDPGDVIVDRQELTVPANYRRGVYAMFLGFFSGNTRLKIEEGPKDDADRVRAGGLQIQ